MLGGTHKKIGMVASLAILRPATIPACLGALAAGSIGGDICDIDILWRKHPAKDEDPERDDHYDGEWEDVASDVILFFLFVIVDWYFGSGAVAWIQSHFGFQTLAAMAVFGLIVVCGMIAAHRSFMHSILVGLVLSGCLYIICAPLVPAFAIGYVSHLLLDLCNRTGMKLFWPIPKRFKLGLCASNKTANAVVDTIGEILLCLLASFFLIRAVLYNEQSKKLLDLLLSPYSEETTVFAAWLWFVNILTFLIENINFSRWLKGKWPYQRHGEGFNREKDTATMDFMQRNMYILFVLGGALGGLLSFIVIAFRGRKYVKNGALGAAMPLFGATCVLIEWSCIYHVIVHTKELQTWVNANCQGLNALYIMIFLIVMSILTYIVYSKDDERINSLSVKTFLELLIAFLGGAAGGLLSINLKGYLSGQAIIRSTVMKMLQTHCLIIAMFVVLLWAH